MIHGPLKMIAIAMITQQIARGLYTVPSKTSPLKKNEVSRVWLSKFKNKYMGMYQNQGDLPHIF